MQIRAEIVEWMSEATKHHLGTQQFMDRGLAETLEQLIRRHEDIVHCVIAHNTDGHQCFVMLTDERILTVRHSSLLGWAPAETPLNEIKSARMYEPQTNDESKGFWAAMASAVAAMAVRCDLTLSRGRKLQFTSMDHQGLRRFLKLVQKTVNG